MNWNRPSVFELSPAIYSTDVQQFRTLFPSSDRPLQPIRTQRNPPPETIIPVVTGRQPTMPSSSIFLFAVEASQVRQAKPNRDNSCHRTQISVWTIRQKTSKVTQEPANGALHPCIVVYNSLPTHSICNRLGSFCNSQPNLQVFRYS